MPDPEKEIFNFSTTVRFIVPNGKKPVDGHLEFRLKDCTEPLTAQQRKAVLAGLVQTDREIASHSGWYYHDLNQDGCYKRVSSLKQMEEHIHKLINATAKASKTDKKTGQQSLPTGLEKTY